MKSHYVNGILALIIAIIAVAQLVYEPTPVFFIVLAALLVVGNATLFIYGKKKGY